MRKMLIAAAAVLAVAVPGVAAAQTGYVDLAYTNTDTDFAGDDVDATSLGGSVAFSGSHAISFQVDGRYANIDAGGGDVDAIGVGGHVYKRGAQWLWGGYAGYTNFDAAGGDIDEWTVAAETQYYTARGTVSGALSYSDAEDFGGGANLVMLEGEYRHFVTDNFSLQGGLGIGSGEIGATDIDVWSGQVGGELQFDRMPISIFAGYRHNSVDAGAGDLDTDSVGVGVRYNWGGTLWDRNRGGAGLNRVPGVLERIVGGLTV